MKRGIVLALLLVTPLATANVLEMALDSGDAAYITSNTGFRIDDQTGTEVTWRQLGAGWNLPAIHILPAEPVNMSAPGARLMIDGRFHQETLLTDPVRPAYDDAAFAVYLRDTNGVMTGLTWSPQFADLGGDVWYTYDVVIADVMGQWPGAPGNGFDLSSVDRITVYCTNWGGYELEESVDYLHLANLVVTPEPASLSLLALGLLGLLRRR
jgi:hypothetical protein